MSEAVQFRIAPILSEKIREQANRQNISVDQLLVSAVNLYLKTEKVREWSAGFEAMGRNPDTNNVDYLLAAGREVVFRD
ncbi:MAG: hypothetical protein ABIY70_14420 [Capsulimonas sp.]|uniref:hypothetical protein n=1 Tax=Capsulimonas sp. TaxID=2494211 RepID=UPI0032651FDE